MSASTNPFDNDFMSGHSVSKQNTSSTLPSSSRSSNIKKHYPTSTNRHIQQQQQSQQHVTTSNQTRGINNSAAAAAAERDPIWEAQGVEWPLVFSFNLPSSQFKKLYKESKLAGNALGISMAYNGDNFGGSGGNGNTLKGGGSTDQDFDRGTSKGDSSDMVGGSGGGGQGSGGDGGGNSGGYYGALGGFMGKLIGTQNQNLIGKHYHFRIIFCFSLVQ